MPDPLKTDLLLALGYAAPQDQALALLDASPLSNPRKTRISPDKRAAVATLLADRLLRVCQRGDCQARAAKLPDGRIPVAATSSADCDLCGGAAAAPALAAMRAACARAGWTRVCVVGGSPAVRQEIRQTAAPPPELRLIDGTIARTAPQARNDLAWADHVVLWGGTQLGHRVSTLYSGSAHCSTVMKRSVQGLWEHLAEAARLAAERGPR
jgi:hypothetical protein